MIIAFGDEIRPVLVEVPDALSADVIRLFSPLRVAAGSGGDPPAFRVTDGDGHFGLQRGSEPVERFGALPDLLAALEYALTMRLLRARPDDVHLHASGAVVVDGAVVAVGPSGSGKSSLALAWSRAGLAVLGDDVLLLGDDGRVRGFPRLIKVERDRLGDHGLRLEDTVAPDPENGEAWFDPAYGGGWSRGRHIVSLVARIAYDGGPSTRIDEFDAAEALRILIDNVQPTGAGPEDAMDRLILMTLGARAVDVRFGDALDAAATLAREASRRRS